METPSTATTTSILGLVFGLAAFFFFRKYASSHLPSTHKKISRETSKSKLISDDDFYKEKVDLSSDTLKKELLDLISRPLNKLPVHADLPRLCHKIQIFIDGEEAWNPLKENFPSDYPTSNMIWNILFELSKAFGTKEEDIVRLRKEFEILFPQNKDFDYSRALLDLLQNVVGEDSKMISLLKCCSQSMVAASVIRLKRSFGSTYPFKDVRGEWRISIEIDSIKGIRIVHRKRERSFEEDSFQFQWSFTMEFDRKLDTLNHAVCRIDTLNFGKIDDSKRKEDVNKIAGPFLNAT